MRQNLNTLIDPIGIPQHCMALAVFIDNQNHRLMGALFDFVMQRLRQKIRGPGIDYHHAFARDDKRKVIVMAGIFICGRGGCPDGRKHLWKKLNWFLV